MEETERFIRLKDGTIYGYSDLLAKRRDATVVDGWAASAWFQGQGIENEITARYAGAIPAARPTYPQSPAATRYEDRTEARERAKKSRADKLALRAEKLQRLNAEPEELKLDESLDKVRELLGDGQDGL